jgi:hypothetical protein
VILIIREHMDKWLEATNRDQVWLAKEYGCHKAYINQILNNKCRIGAPVIEKFLTITHMRFEDLFYFDGAKDTREFYGERMYLDGEMINNDEYKKRIKRA